MGVPLYSDVPANLSVAQAKLGLPPSIQNFRPEKLRRLRKAFMRTLDGNVQSKVGFLGDSQTAGLGAGSSTLGITGARPKSVPSVFTKLLRRRGWTVETDSNFGHAGRTKAEYQLMDPKMVIGAGWDVSGSSVFGQKTWTNSTDNTALPYTPELAFDKIVVSYLTGAGAGWGIFTVDVDGGAALATIDTRTGVSGLSTQTITCSSGTHTVNLKRTTVGAGARTDIAQIHCYNSATGQIGILNIGCSGAPLQAFTDSANPYSAANVWNGLGLDAAIICLGTNNWSNAGNASGYDIGAAAFKTQYQILLDALPNADKIIVIPPPNTNAASPSDRQASYRQAIRDVAVTNDLPLIDLFEYYKTQEDEYAAGFYYDDIHQNGLGYANWASILMTAIASVCAA